MRFISRYIKLLSSKEKKELPILIVSAISRRLLELLGLAFFLPSILVLVGPLSDQTMQWLVIAKPLLGDISPRALGIWLCAIALLFLPLKTIISTVLLRAQTRYLMRVYRALSNRTFQSYMTQGLPFINKNHSSDLTFHVNGVSFSASSMIGTLIDAFGELFLTLILIALVMMTSPGIMGLLLLCIIPSVLIYGRYLKDKMNQLGKTLIEAKRMQTRVVQNAFKGYVNMRVDNYSSSVWKNYQRGIDEIASQTERMQLLGRIPTALIEVIVAVILFLLIFFDSDSQAVFKPIYVVFGFAALRLLPSMLSLLNAWSQLQSNIFIVEMLDKDVADSTEWKEPNNESSSVICYDHQISVDKLSFSYDPGNYVLYNMNFTIHKGERIGVVGPSGVGKSTLFYLLMGFYEPTSGTIRIDGVLLNKRNSMDWQKMIGVVEQKFFLHEDSLLKNIIPDMDVVPDYERVLYLLRKVGLYDWAMALPMGIDSSLGESGCLVSGGQRQRIAIVRALYKRPQILFFDEATSSLDDKNEREIIDLLSNLSIEESITLLIIAHRQSSLVGCDRLIEVPYYETYSK